MKKKQQITAEFLMDYWLLKGHGITVKWLLENESELIKTSDWYLKYAVSLSIHDEWYEWAITELCKANGRSLSKKSRELMRRGFCFDYLNIAPSIKEPTKVI